MSTLVSTVKANPWASGAFAGGGLLKAGQSILGGFEQNAADSNVAALYKQQSQLDIMNAGAQVQQVQQEAVKDISAGEATAGASGVTSAGSPAMATAKTISDANTKDVFLRYAGRLKSNSDLYQSQLESYSGKQAEIAGAVGGGASILGSVAEIATI